jgi:6-phosphogluconolactonase (cycloisomerase 2 family)
VKSLPRAAALTAGIATASLSLLLGPAGLAGAESVFYPPGPSQPGHGGAVFVQTDNPSGNQVIVFAQHRDGRLSEVGTVSTGGDGAVAAGSQADHLASQGSLVYDAQRQLLFAVNAGSDTISVLSAQGRNVRGDQVLSAGGEFPNSIAVDGNLVYVLNAGGAGSVSGFEIFGNSVAPIPNSTRSLGLSNTNPPFFLDAPGQVTFGSGGNELVVSTKASSNSIDVFQVGLGGLLSAAPTVNSDATNVPFSFASTPAGQLVVAEAATSSLHTYSFGPDGTLASDSASVGDGQSALCWVTAADGFYYVDNAGSNDVSAYAVAANGTPSLVGTTGVVGTTDAGPIDLSASVNGEFLYTEAGVAGSVDEFEINADGSLSPLGSVAGLGAGIEGIAAD